MIADTPDIDTPVEYVPTGTTLRVIDDDGFTLTLVPEGGDRTEARYVDKRRFNGRFQVEV